MSFVQSLGHEYRYLKGMISFLIHSFVNDYLQLIYYSKLTVSSLILGSSKIKPLGYMPPVPIIVLILTVIFDISGISGDPGFPGKGRAKHSETHSLYEYFRIFIYKFY